MRTSSLFKKEQHNIDALVIESFFSTPSRVFIGKKVLSPSGFWMFLVFRSSIGKVPKSYRIKPYFEPHQSI